MVQEHSPLVTVYIPTRNRVKLLERALRSVLRQTYAALEILVVDDASTDGTQRFMKAFAARYPIVRYLRHELPRGANAARNSAIREARGLYVTGLDDDDEFLPERIEKMVAAYSEEFAYVCTGWRIVESDGKTHIQEYHHDRVTLDDMLYANITGNQVLTTKEMLLSCGLFDETLSAAQDYDMWLRMLEKKPAAKRIPRPLYIMHRSGGESITTSGGRVYGYLQCYRKHKHRMSRDHRKTNLVYFRTIKEKRITSLRILSTLYPKRQWPRLFLGYWKRRLL